MQQIKLFVGREDHTADLERDVNTWVSESGAKVSSISGNISPQSVLRSKDAGTNLSTTGTHTRRFAPSDILIIVTYEKG